MLPGVSTQRANLTNLDDNYPWGKYTFVLSAASSSLLSLIQLEVKPSAVDKTTKKPVKATKKPAATANGLFRQGSPRPCLFKGNALQGGQGRIFVKR